MKKKVLIICTGNSCRSQMAEGLLRNMAGDRFEVFSAGTHPSYVNPRAIEAMSEIGIDISGHTSDSINEYLGTEMDYVITVCDSANALCPNFPGAKEQIHWSIDDPFHARGGEEAVKAEFARVRDDLKTRLERTFKV